MEVAWMNRRKFSRDGRARMERWFYETAMQRRIPAGEERSGFVYTNRTSGTKGFNLDVFTGETAQNFTFFVPIPGFAPDYLLVDFDTLYAPGELVRVPAGDTAAIRRAVESLPCCSSDPQGSRSGDPLNVVLVGSDVAVQRMLLRANWQETDAEAARTSTAYRHRYRGRPPDAILTKSRPDGSERTELRLWLSPYRYDEDWVWLGQVSQDLSETTVDPDDYVSDPDIDRARDYLLQNVWYSQSLQRVGFTDGVPESTAEAPQETFSGSAFFTDGLRVVMFLSETPVALGDAEIQPWRLMAR
jgi:hypothetical protein